MVETGLSSTIEPRQLLDLRRFRHSSRSGYIENKPLTNEQIETILQAARVALDRDTLLVTALQSRINALATEQVNRDDPEQQKRHSMELLRDAPMDMGLGIKREAPRHY